MKSTKQKPLKFAPRPHPREAERERRQSDFLRFLAQGESIHDACALVGVTRSCYEHWRTRHKDFPAAVAAARESHRRDIACGFHTADAYARVLLDAIQRDESLPAALRYRAAKSILTRKGKADWLPEPLPADAAPLEPYEDEEPRPHHPESAPAQPKATPAHEAVAVPPFAAPARKPTLVSTAATVASGANTPANPAPRQHENPDNPDNPAQPVHRANTMQNQQDAATPGAPGDARTFFSAPDKAPTAPATQTTPAAPSAARVESPFEAAPPNPAHSSSATSSPGPSSPNRSEPAPSSPGPTGASSAFSHPSLNPYFLHRHESPAAFEALHESHIRAYAPATPAEELLVFRITQKAWLLRRLETWERVIADSHVTRVRERHPNTPAPACIALSLLEARETASTRFHHRTACLRKDHEAALDRLEAKLLRHQQRRESAPHPARQNPLQVLITPRLNQARADKSQNATAASTASSFPGGVH